ncbi:MAG: protein translocase subunit SecD [Armatimonadetes bacterium]|nr:protein translocase subunit SecD [Armatimonadota bacterium]
MRNVAFFLGILAVVVAAAWFDVQNRVYPIREGLDLKGGVRVVVQVDHAKMQQMGQPFSSGQIVQVRDILESRVNQFGLSGTDVKAKGDDQVEIQLPGARDPEQVVGKLITTAQLEFRWLKSVQSTRSPTARYRMEVAHGGRGQPDIYTFYEGDKPVPEQKILEESELILTGRDLEPKSVQDTEMQTGKIVVRFELKPEGARTFADFTRQHVNEFLAIVLDNRIISAPNVNEPITQGQGQIEGGFKTPQEARDLAVLLNSGALPVPLQVIERQEVGATLGAEAVRASIQAGLVGLGLVLLFMLGYYLLPGVLANIALLFYAALTFAIYKLMQVTMDLPSITGFILSVGMAVDANILIFERLKEEMRSGKTLHSAIDAGFSRAFSSIFDSNVSTWITCFILFQLGAPLIKGFALTLAIGVAVSMFTAITVTRTMLHLLVNWEWARTERLFGLGISWLSFRLGQRHLDIMGRRRLYLGFSGILVLTAIALLVKPGLNLGIDFTGGSQVQVTYEQPVADHELRAKVDEVLTRHGLRDARVTLGRTPLRWTRLTATGGEVADTVPPELERRLNDLKGAESVTVKKEGKTLSVTATYASEHTQPEFVSIFSQLGIPNPQVNVSPPEETRPSPVVFVLTKLANTDEKVKAVYNDLRELPYGAVRSASSQTLIGPSVARELVRGAFFSVLLASLAIIAYLGYRFAIGGFVNGIKFGAAAVVALLHDVLFAVGVFAVMGALRGWQVDSFFVTAALTIIGFSVHDTIVVFDRIRENLRNRLPRETLIDLVNRSVTQTFDRSINTSLTVILVLLALLVLGGESIKPFNAALLAGIAIGTYSSIFVASPLVVLWERASQRSAAEARKKEDVRLQSRPAGTPRPARPRPEPQAAPVAKSGAVERTAAEVAAKASPVAPARPAGRGTTTIRPKRKRRS